MKTEIPVAIVMPAFTLERFHGSRVGRSFEL